MTNDHGLCVQCIVLHKTRMSHFERCSIGLQRARSYHVIAILIRPEWWDAWAMFLLIPLLLIVLVVAVWSIISGLKGIVEEGDSAKLEGSKVPDIMGFLKQRRKPARFLFDTTRRHFIGR